MNVIFRVDGSVKIGSGHIMRCLSLAEYLHNYGAECSFITRYIDTDFNETIHAYGFSTTTLSDHSLISGCDVFGCSDETLLSLSWREDVEKTVAAINSTGIKPDWLIVDHYSLDINWESALRTFVNNIMVVDDLANRVHDCDILLDQNYYANMNSRYDGLVPSYCKKFLGPQYLLLRNEFKNAYLKRQKVNVSIERIFMFFGTCDASHVTLKALRALSYLDDRGITVDVIIGKGNIDKKEIERLIKSLPHVSYHYNVMNIAELMARSDLVVIAAGGCIWEACYLNLPVIAIITAQNQFEAVSTLGEEGFVWNLGWHYNITSNDIASVIDSACKSPGILNKMAINAKQLVGHSSKLSQLISAIKAPCSSNMP